MDVMEKTQQVTTAHKQGPETRNINIDNTVPSNKESMRLSNYTMDFLFLVIGLSPCMDTHFIPV